eukprot:13308092-Heterocapsa_arctica.AAC.1
MPTLVDSSAVGRPLGSGCGRLPRQPVEPLHHGHAGLRRGGAGRPRLRGLDLQGLRGDVVRADNSRVSDLRRSRPPEGRGVCVIRPTVYAS